MAFVVVVVREGGGGEWEQGCSVYRVVRGVAAAGRWAVLELIGVKWMRLQIRNFYERIVNSAWFWHSYFLLPRPPPPPDNSKTFKHLAWFFGCSRNFS